MPYKDPEARREYVRQYAIRIKENPEEVERIRRRRRGYYHDNTDKWHSYYVKNTDKKHIYDRELYLNKNYGISSADFITMATQQNFACGGCFDAFDMRNTKNIHVDHDHETGLVRGLLCRECNIALGILKDSAERAHNLAKYRERYP